MREKLLRTIQNVMREKYTVSRIDIVEDLRNCINILCEELKLLYEAGGGLQGSVESIDTIIKSNEEKLCEVCCQEENSKYTTLKNIYNTAFGELDNIISDKELQIYTILVSMIFSNIEELEDILDIDVEELQYIEVEEIMKIVIKAIEKLVNDFIDNDEIEYFDNLVCYISEYLEEII